LKKNTNAFIFLKKKLIAQYFQLDFIPHEVIFKDLFASVKKSGRRRKKPYLSLFGTMLHIEYQKCDMLNGNKSHLASQCLLMNFPLLEGNKQK